MNTGARVGKNRGNLIKLGARRILHSPDNARALSSHSAISERHMSSQFVGYPASGMVDLIPRYPGLFYAQYMTRMSRIALMPPKTVPRRSLPRAGEFRRTNQTNYWGRAMSNGWTLKRRVRQATLIRSWEPWMRSTGPRTEGGKATSAVNALRHGMRSRRALDEARILRTMIRQCRDTAQEVADTRVFWVLQPQAAAFEP